MCRLGAGLLGPTSWHPGDTGAPPATNGEDDLRAELLVPGPRRNHVGILRSETTDWEVGAIVERTTGSYRVLEVGVPLMEDIDGMVATSSSNRQRDSRSHLGVTYSAV